MRLKFIMTFFLSLFVISGHALASGASNESRPKILGDWQAEGAQGKTMFISIVLDPWGKLKILPCHRTTDIDNNLLDIVVCSSKPNSGKFLEYNQSKDSYKVSYQSLTSFTLRNEILAEKTLLGFSETFWMRADKNIMFLYNSYTDY